MDLEKLMQAWAVARKALEKSENDYRVAKAGYETALQCEREAWAKLEELHPKEQPHATVDPQVAAENLRRAMQQRTIGQYPNHVSFGTWPMMSATSFRSGW